MRLYSLKRKQVVNKPPVEVFDFFSKPENLARITPSNMGFNTLTPSPIVMRTGTVIDYTIKILGFSVHWRTLISSFDPPRSFTDEQLKGPYSIWHHKHQFEKTENGTFIKDNVTYALPFGFLGRIVHTLFVKRQLNHIFDYRFTVIKEILSR
jgi:ligand-binding SRPBCC domain-containing protein